MFTPRKCAGLLRRKRAAGTLEIPFAGRTDTEKTRAQLHCDSTVSSAFLAPPPTHTPSTFQQKTYTETITAKLLLPFLRNLLDYRGYYNYPDIIEFSLNLPYKTTIL